MANKPCVISKHVNSFFFKGFSTGITFGITNEKDIVDYSHWMTTEFSSYESLETENAYFSKDSWHERHFLWIKYLKRFAAAKFKVFCLRLSIWWLVPEITEHPWTCRMTSKNLCNTQFLINSLLLDVFNEKWMRNKTSIIKSLSSVVWKLF